jgi:hypothetical protein
VVVVVDLRDERLRCGDVVDDRLGMHCRDWIHHRSWTHHWGRQGKRYDVHRHAWWNELLIGKGEVWVGVEVHSWRRLLL